jgi:chromosome segregation ATPase
MKYDTLERSHKVLEQQCLFDKEYIAQRDDTITKLNLNAERQQKAIAELRHLLETERDSKRIMREEFELER